MRRSVPTLLLVCAVALAGCTTAGTTSSKKFSGPTADVAKAISDVQSAAQRKDGAKLCTQLFASAFVTKLAAPGSTCTQEVDKALSDSDTYSLDVQTVTVNGSQATARVRQGKGGATRQVTLVREANRWKLSGVTAR
jgi:hypothetical protein